MLKRLLFKTEQSNNGDSVNPDAGGKPDTEGIQTQEENLIREENLIQEKT